MLLINCKVELELAWGGKSILANAGTAATFKIIDTKLYVAAVTLLTEDYVKLVKQLSDGFKRSVYWNKHKLVPTEKEEPPNHGTINIENCLILVFKKLKDYLFLLMMIVMQIVELKSILIKRIFFQK